MGHMGQSRKSIHQIKWIMWCFSSLNPTENKVLFWGIRDPLNWPNEKLKCLTGIQHTSPKLMAYKSLPISGCWWLWKTSFTYIYIYIYLHLFIYVYVFRIIQLTIGGVMYFRGLVKPIPRRGQPSGRRAFRWHYLLASSWSLTCALGDYRGLGPGRNSKTTMEPWVCMCMYVCIYIYMCVCVSIYVYIYIRQKDWTVTGSLFEGFSVYTFIWGVVLCKYC